MIISLILIGNYEVLHTAIIYNALSLKLYIIYYFSLEVYCEIASIASIALLISGEMGLDCAMSHK